LTPNKWKLTWRDFEEFRYRRQQLDLAACQAAARRLAARNLLLPLAAIISAVKI